LNGLFSVQCKLVPFGLDESAVNRGFDAALATQKRHLFRRILHPVLENRPLIRPLYGCDQARIWVNSPPLPPEPFRPQLEDRKMQVRRVRIRISR